MSDIRIEKRPDMSIMYAESEAGEEWLEAELGPAYALDTSWSVETAYLPYHVKNIEADGLEVTYA
jgi:hypothetical protein